jgi:hypothetical protein
MMWKHAKRDFKFHKYFRVKGNIYLAYKVQRNDLQKEWDICQVASLLTVGNN